jgi:hypothetical protein
MNGLFWMNDDGEIAGKILVDEREVAIYLPDLEKNSIAKFDFTPDKLFSLMIEFY